MSGVLALALAATLALTYATLARTARAAANDRLRRAVDQVAAAVAPGIERIKDSLRAVAREPAIIAAASQARPALSRDTAVSPAVIAHLRRLRMPTDTTLPVVLWSVDGERLAAIGANPPGKVDPRITLAPETGAPPIPVPGLEALARSDTPQIGKLYDANHRIAYWLGAAVFAGGRRVGYVTAQRVVQPNPGTTKLIRSLSSDEVTAYYRNVDGAFWTTVGGELARPPASRDSTTRGIVVRRDGVELLSADQRIPGTPLGIVFEASTSDVLASARRGAGQLAAIGFSILMLGSFALWGISRRITRPIVDLTTAAESLAAGDFSVRVATARSDEIGRLARSFNRMATEIGASRDELELRTAQAQNANRAKSDFLATMSHELRTPLNAIAGYVDLIDMELRGPVTEAQRRDLARIRASQQHLLGLISSILDLTRIESGQVAYTLEPVVLRPFLSGLDALIGPQAAAKSLSLRVERCGDDVVALADREKLRQILLNLLSNAIRFTPSGGEITLSCEGRSRDMVAIVVADTGIGIPHEKQGAVFEPFVQLDRSLTRTAEGVGIGLAISRDLARGMNGDLSLTTSVPGEGSRFAVLLPRAATEGATTTTVSGETRAVRSAPRLSR